MKWVKNIEDWIEYEKWYHEKFLEAYRKRVFEFYEDEYKQCPECFPFMEPTTAVYIFRDYEILTYYVHSKLSVDEFIYKIDEFDSEEEYEKVRRLPEHLQEERLLKIAGIHDYILRDISWYGEDEDTNPGYYEGVPINKGNTAADNHYKKFMEQNNLSNFISEEIMNLVNSDQFKYEFVESIKAYNYNLFLASTVTAAVSLETLLKVIIEEKLGSDFLPNDNKHKYILNYAQILFDNNIIDERIHHSIKALNELRRSGAHSKSGKLKKWDAEQMILGIVSVIESIF